MIKYPVNENSSNKPSDNFPKDENKHQWTTGRVRNGVGIIFLSIGWKARIFILSLLTVLVSITEKVFVDTNS